MHCHISSFFQDFSKICGRSDEDVALSPPEQCPDLDSLHFPESHANLITISHQTKHFLTAHRIEVQRVRRTEEPPRGHLRPNQEREKSSTFHFYLGKVVARKDTSVFPESQKRYSLRRPRAVLFVAASAVNSGHPVCPSCDVPRLPIVAEPVRILGAVLPLVRYVAE